MRITSGEREALDLATFFSGSILFLLGFVWMDTN